MKHCTSCGSPIPDGQGSSCSMCMGVMGWGKDGYYEEWAKQQRQKEIEQKQIKERQMKELQRQEALRKNKMEEERNLIKDFYEFCGFERESENIEKAIDEFLEERHAES